MTRHHLSEAEIDEISRRPFDPTKGEVVHERRPGRVVFSARIPAELSPALIEEATRCDQNPSQLIADLVAEALQARAAKAEPVLVNLADLHRAIDAVARTQTAA